MPRGARADSNFKGFSGLQKESLALKQDLLDSSVTLQDRLGQTRSDLAKCAQLTQVVSERLEAEADKRSERRVCRLQAVEAQLRAELAKLMVLGQQTAVRMEATPSQTGSVLFASRCRRSARQCRRPGSARTKGTAGTAHGVQATAGSGVLSGSDSTKAGV